MRQLAPVDAATWRNLLAAHGVGDIYYLDGYLELSALLEPGGAGVLYAAGDEAGATLLPAIRRPLPSGADGFDLVTPYGYGGPLVVGDALAAPMQPGPVSTFVRYHPLLATQQYALPGTEVVQLAGTVAWNVEPGRDLLAAMHGKHRNVVRKAQAAGVEVVAVEQPRDLAAFVELYELTMQRQQADPFYFFAREYWDAMVELTGDHVLRFDAVLDGRVIASALCFATAPFLHYHLGATADDARTLGASNLVLYEAARWAQGAGFTRLHLGGGVGGRADSLLAFKRRFDPDGLVECAIGKLVDDPERYRFLAGTSDTAGFFPAYRDLTRVPA